MSSFLVFFCNMYIFFYIVSIIIIIIIITIIVIVIIVIIIMIIITMIIIIIQMQAFVMGLCQSISCVGFLCFFYCSVLKYFHVRSVLKSIL